MILVVALVARIGVLVATPDFEPLFDAADFDRHAESIANGDGYPRSQLGVDGPTAFRPPGYPVVLAAVDLVGGGWTAMRILGALLGVATVALIFLIAQRIWDRRVAVVAGGIAAVFPPLVVLNVSLLSEVLFLPLALASIWAVLAFRDDRRLRWAAAAGVLCGLAVLTRVNGLPLVLALAFGVWVLSPRFSRRALVAPAVVVLAMVLTLLPWVVRNTLEFDRLVGVSTGGGYALAGTYNEESRERADHAGRPFSPNRLRTFQDEFRRRDLDEDELVGEMNGQATDFMKDNPGYVVKTVLWNVPRVFDVERSDEFERAFASSQVQAVGVENIDSPFVYLLALYAVVLLAVAGAVVQARGSGLRRAPSFVWAAPLLLLIPPLVIYGLPRYRAPVDPFLVLLAAVAVVALADARRGASRPGSAGP